MIRIVTKIEFFGPWILDFTLFYCPSKKFRQNPFTTFFSYPTSHLTNSFSQSKHGYLAANSNYHYLKHFLPVSITCKFHRATFTAKFHCLQIPTIRLYRQSPLHANSETTDLLPKSIRPTCRFNYLQIHTTPLS